MTSEHPITPPLELVQQWWTDAQTLESNDSQEIRFIVNVAARWGADQELEACCELIADWIPQWVEELKEIRRPKPPTMKEQALEALEQLLRDPEAGCFSAAPDIIRRALEALPND
jgi:hypothetical protein